MLKKVSEFIRRNWAAFLAALLALAGAFRLIQGQKVKRLVKEAQNAKEKAEALRSDAAVETEKQKARLREQDARMREGEQNKERAGRLNERLDKLKKKHGLLLLIIGILLLTLVAGPVKASDEAALPTDYAALAKIYFQALDRITELKADLEEAIGIAGEYKQLYEDERRLRLQAEAAVTEAEAAVSRALEREKELQAVIQKQHETILQLAVARKSPLSFTAGVRARVAMQPEGLALVPEVAVGVEFRP
ncbi:MAG: hypothetical protein ACM3ZU_07870 [Bacteroidota bacterium]